MKIYVVTNGEYSEYHICAVFTDKKKAELYCSIREEKEFLDNFCYMFSDEYMIEEYDTDDSNIEGTVYYGVRAVIFENVDDRFNDYTTFRSTSPITDRMTEANRYCRSGMRRRDCKIYTYSINELIYNELKDDTFVIRDYIKERMKDKKVEKKYTEYQESEE